MDKDKAVGIQKFNYTDDSNGDITDDLRKYQFYMWAANFSEADASKGSLEILSSKQMSDIFYDRNIEHQVFLRANVKEDPLITDEYNCLFFQVKFQIDSFSFFFKIYQFEIFCREIQRIIPRLHVLLKKEFIKHASMCKLANSQQPREQNVKS